MLLAESEGVDGLLCHHLSRLKEAKIPETARSRLEQRYKEQIQLQAGIKAEAEFISALLEGSGLSAIGLQGLSLSDIYNIPGVRPMGDMDILIQPQDRAQVVSLLQKIGFHIPDPVYPDNLLKHVLWLDIHTHFLNIDRIRSRQFIFPKGLTGLWKRALPLFKSSAGLLTPDPLDNFVLLCAHTFKHNYSRMIWLVDLHESLDRIRSLPDGWEKLIERVRYWGQEKIVVYGLIVSEGILGTTIPKWVKEELNFNDLGSIEKYLLRLRIKGGNRLEYYVPLCFFAIKNIRGKLEFIVESMFPKRDIMAQIYLNSPSHSRFNHITHRLVQTLSLVGNGLRQALLHGPFSR